MVQRKDLSACSKSEFVTEIHCLCIHCLDLMRCLQKHGLKIALPLLGLSSSEVSYLKNVISIPTEQQHSHRPIFFANEDMENEALQSSETKSS